MPDENSTAPAPEPSSFYLPLEPREASFLVMVFLAGAALLITARSLEPAAEGIGTHMQLGMDACGYLERNGKPCPTCGMTTSFAHFADLEVIDAFRVQPLGAILFVATAAATVTAAVHLIRRRSIAPILMRFPNRWVNLIVLVTLVLAAWKWTLYRAGF